MNAPAFPAARLRSTLPAIGAGAAPATPLDRARVRIEGLDVLRLFAALCVVLFHYAFRGAVADNLTRVSLPSLAPVAQYGFIGVDMFFAISGFVIAWSAEGRTWRQFALARFARIYPAFVVCMTATFAVTWLWGRPRFETSPAQWAANLLVAAPAVGEASMDGAYWSIVCEIVFYGWMALLIGVGAFPRHARLLLFAWMALTVLNEFALDSYPLRKLFLTNHSGFFAAGVLLYLRRAGGGGVLTSLLLGLSVLVAACQLPIIANGMQEYYRVPYSNLVLVLCALGAIGIVAAASAVRDVKLRPGAVAAIGGLTYPLYLLHQNAGYIIFNRLEGGLPAPAIVALTTAIMLVAAWMVWRFVETPSRRAIYRLADRLSALVARLKKARSLATNAQ